MSTERKNKELVIEQNGYKYSLQNIGDNIELYRDTARIKQRRIAFDIDISNTFLCDIEKGRVYPSLKTLMKIADYLNINIANLLSDKKNPNLPKTNIALTDIGYKLRRARKKAKMPQKQIAHLLDISYTYICDIERGNCNSGLTILFNLLDLLNIDIETFFTPIEED